jgi:asparagine synthase (glutamine-hydrolysing)
MVCGKALANLIGEHRDGREDRSKQIWQLLTLELWYRNVQSMGVAA